jgi:hypothetical protein
MAGKLAKTLASALMVLGAVILPLKKANCQENMLGAGIKYNQSGNSGIYLNSFLKNNYLQLGIGQNSIDFFGCPGFKTNENKISPIIAYNQSSSKQESQDATTEEKSNTPMLGLEAKLNLGNFRLGVQLSQANETNNNLTNERTTDSQHLVDISVPYDYNIGTVVNAETNVDVKNTNSGGLLSLGTENLELFASAYQNKTNISGDINAIIETTMTGQIANTPINDYSKTTSTSAITDEQISQQNSAGLTYYLQNPWLATLNVWKDSEVNASARIVIPVSGKYIDDLAESEKDINNYLRSNDYGDVRENITRLREKKSDYSSTIILSFDTQGNASLKYNGENIDVGVRCGNGNIGITLDYKNYGIEGEKTKDGSTNCSLNYNTQF